MEHIEPKAEEILDTARGLVVRIFNKRPGVAYGPLNYTPEEARFTATVFGDDPQEMTATMAEQVTERSWSRRWRFGLSKDKNEGREPKPIPECRIDPEALRPQYGALIEELGDNIRRNPWLKDQVEDMRERLMGSAQYGAE